LDTFGRAHDSSVELAVSRAMAKRRCRAEQFPLSDLALGWSTYGVGDQMSHYNLNASVPKALVRFLLCWAAASARGRDRRDRDLSGARPRRRGP
jgi:hypothetical protein